MTPVSKIIRNDPFWVTDGSGKRCYFDFGKD